MGWLNQCFFVWNLPRPISMCVWLCVFRLVQLLSRIPTHTHILILITQNRCWMISFSPECHGHGDIASSSSYVKTTKPHDIQILVPYTSEHEHVERNKFLILKMKSSEPSLLFWVQNVNVPITPRKRIYPLKIDGSLLMFQKSSYNP